MLVFTVLLNMFPITPNIRACQGKIHYFSANQWRIYQAIGRDFNSYPIQESRRGGCGGKHPSCLVARDVRGQEWPCNESIYFFNNVKYDDMKIMNLKELCHVGDWFREQSLDKGKEPEPRLFELIS